MNSLITCFMYYVIGVISLYTGDGLSRYVRQFHLARASACLDNRISFHKKIIYYVIQCSELK